MTGRIAAIAAVLTLIAATAFAHAGLRASNPVAGAALGDSPQSITLSFSERPDLSLSDIRVADANGVTYQTGVPAPISGDEDGMSVSVRRLDTGVYIVSWRVVSAVDGHSTAGSFAFGVRADPGRVQTAGTAGAISPLEVAARWLFLSGLIFLLGAACASIGRFGGPRDAALASAGCLAAWAGLALLAAAQLQAAGAGPSVLARTAIGVALAERAIALAVATAGIALARGGTPPGKRVATAMIILASLAAMLAHVHAGHSSASGLGSRAGVLIQWLHVAASGVWFGGLAALLLAIAGAGGDARMKMVRRFSTVAAVCLVLVLLTGAIRSVDEIASAHELISTPYGRAILLKIALALVIAPLGAVNRWRSVPGARTSVRLLSRIGTAELALAAAAIGTAALLGSLAPPASARIPFISASGVDFGTTVRARLTTASDQPGPNRFTLALEDYDSRAPVQARRVSLQFTPLDDPDVAPTSLELAPAGEHYEGSGANIAFEGRWRATALVERDRGSVLIPIDVATATRPQPLSIARVPREKPMFTVEVAELGQTRFVLDAERPGPQGLMIICFDRISEPRPMTSLLVTAGVPGQPVQQLSVQRASTNVFQTTVELSQGDNDLVAIGRTADGARMRAEIHLTIPRS